MFYYYLSSMTDHEKELHKAFRKYDVISVVVSINLMAKYHKTYISLL